MRPEKPDGVGFARRVRGTEIGDQLEEVLFRIGGKRPA